MNRRLLATDRVRGGACRSACTACGGGGGGPRAQSVRHRPTPHRRRRPLRRRRQLRPRLQLRRQHRRRASNYDTAEYQASTMPSPRMPSPPTMPGRRARASRSASSTAASIPTSPNSPAGSIRRAATSPERAESATKAATVRPSALSPRPRATTPNTMGVAFDATIVSERADDRDLVQWHRRKAVRSTTTAIAAGIDAARSCRREGDQPVARAARRPGRLLLSRCSGRSTPVSCWSSLPATTVHRQPRSVRADPGSGLSGHR